MHLIGNVAVAVPLLVADIAVRLDDPVDGLRWEGLTLTVLLSLALAVTGWAGGELAYRHGIGVSARQPELGLPARAVVSDRSATEGSRDRQVRLAEQAPDHARADERRLHDQAERIAREPRPRR